MKKTIYLTLITLALVLLIILSLAIYISFKIIRPTTKTINAKIEEKLAKLVYIPKGIMRPGLALNLVSYTWEMETPQKEVAGINFTYTPSYSKNENNIQVLLEMKPPTDPSVFKKVLPAVISDQKSLNSAQEKENEDLKPNPQIGYSEMSVERNQQGQPTKIYWNFKKDALGKDLKSKYKELEQYPNLLLIIFYEIPNTLIGFVSG